MDGLLFPCPMRHVVAYTPILFPLILKPVTMNGKIIKMEEQSTGFGLPNTHRAQALTAPLATILPLPSPPPLGEASRKLLRTEKTY